MRNLQGGAQRPAALEPTHVNTFFGSRPPSSVVVTKYQDDHKGGPEEALRRAKAVWGEGKGLGRNMTVRTQQLCTAHCEMPLWAGGAAEEGR